MSINHITSIGLETKTLSVIIEREHRIKVYKAGGHWIKKLVTSVVCSTDWKMETHTDEDGCWYQLTRVELR